MITASIIGERILQEGLIKMLEIKDSDIRIMILEQGRDAIDKGVHIGGAFSAAVPMVALYYGGMMNFDVENPSRIGQDLFVLSKGHAVATLASIYVDLGYAGREVLKNSRSWGSILKGHPGPTFPGVHISTGPEGHGMPVAQGFALGGKREPHFDVYCLTGDGELQAGMIWEAIMFAGARRLDNLCVLVDKNEGQLDNTRALVFPMPDVGKRFESFGWRAIEVDATGYESVLEALRIFKYSVRDGRPTAIICNTLKGWGGFSSFTMSHKVELPDAFTEQELSLQKRRREERVQELFRFLQTVEKDQRRRIMETSPGMHFDIDPQCGRVTSRIEPVVLRKAEPRSKKVDYVAQNLPKLDSSKEYSAGWIISESMKVFARSARVVSIDSDLGTTSGLEAGIGFVDKNKALNVGVAESNMMCVGEAFAVLGFNTWVSTFCPFFDWRVLRRIAINYQERSEAMQSGMWLNTGHNLDLVFLATAANFETRTNGATHMGNDDIMVFSQIAHVKIVDLSCPNQLLGFLRWVMEGEKGLVYARIMRSASKVIYDGDFTFEYGKGYWTRGSLEEPAIIVSSGRGVHEALAAATALEAMGIQVAVVDMPSVDEDLIVQLYGSGKKIFIAEQNNGYLWKCFQSILWKVIGLIDTNRLYEINALDARGQPQFVHSATYGQLLEHFGLSGGQLADRISNELTRRDV